MGRLFVLEAHLDRAPGSYPGGGRFDSGRGRHLIRCPGEVSMMLNVVFKSGASLEIEVEDEELQKLGDKMMNGTLFESTCGPALRMSEVVGYAPVYETGRGEEEEEEED